MFEQVGQQVQHQNENIGSLRTDVAQIQTNVADAAAATDRTLQSLRASFSSDLDEKLSSQFARFESLLAKKARQE